jgi:hypothetical protein
MANVGVWNWQKQIAETCVFAYVPFRRTGWFQ